jgi:PilZ domain
MQVPTGRYERRIARAEVVELLYMDELPMEKHGANTENMSPQGARVITDSICAPGKPVFLRVPEENLKLPARVVYCQRLEDGRFAIGLQLRGRVERWQKPP